MMKDLGTAFLDTMTEGEFAEEFQKYRIIFEWEKIVGPQIGKDSHVQKIENKMMKVVAKYGTTMQEIHMRAPQIIHGIEKRYGAGIVEQIRVVIGGQKKIIKEDPTYSPEEGQIPMDKSRLSAGAVKKISEIVAPVTDERLKYELEELAEVILKKEFYMKKNGYHRCPTCNTYLDPDEKECFLCAHKRKRKRIGKIKELLIANPSLRFEDVQRIFPCSMQEMLEGKRESLQYYLGQLYTDEPSMELRYFVAMLMTGKKYSELTEKQVIAFTEPYTIAGKEKRFSK